VAERRFPPLVVDELTGEQRDVVVALLAGPRGGGAFPDPIAQLREHPLPLGPFEPLLASPKLADLAQQVGAHLRFGSELPDVLRELAILVVARHWNTPFEWIAHHPLAIRFGLDRAAAEAIAAAKRPADLPADQTAVHDFVAEMVTGGQVTDATFAAVKAAVGGAATMDLIGVVGYYTWIGFVLNVDRYELPGDVTDPFGS
jgi:4-carboxymuconolactone decarboxylase